ncbi:SUMO-specific isopeptidase USPL1 isoform X2 [Nycticebus coucang]|uniref:SUMO-specific isopeptidase USPL1 isoform X2 n=1 Tax=Nycticebus coucang TaxID=9470 RepID=UPI00234E24E5|nr:SUMO-specific isopeptidase USPL1 isoform X2 [Nycticebus coucang]
MMDSPKIGNGLPVIGPGTDIGISSLHMVGYLGKNYDSAKVTADGYCPACKEKGKLKVLKTYRISFQESVFLCEDLQCIYPLGSKSLSKLISPDSEECHTPSKPQKRKILEANCKDSLLLANSKKTRNHIVIDGEQILNSKHNGEVYDETSSNSIKTADSLEQNEILEADIVDSAIEKDPTTVDVSGTVGTSPQNEGCTSELEMALESKRTSFHQALCVQWKNAYALCWLDCILSALVHLEGLKNTVTQLCTKEDSVFWQLFTKYNQANKLLYANQLDGVKDGDCKILNSETYAKIKTCLNEVRDEIFSRLQPQLRCTLGDMESPVFAFPLLLKIEPHIEKLFLYSFSWDFECSQCGHRYQNRCMKSLVTFTNIIPEWHPLNAAHFGPCNSCNDKSQIRKMALEKASPIFMLHFVQGLPQNDLQQYAFHFEGCLYQVTSVIQYQANNHFITWILDADGSWLECDDLKGLHSERHENFEVPASEIHIVIWERKTAQVTDKEAACPLLKKSNDQHVFSDEKLVSSGSNGEKTVSLASSDVKSGSAASSGEKPVSSAFSDEKPGSAASSGEKPLSSASSDEKPVSSLFSDEKPVPSALYSVGNDPSSETTSVIHTTVMSVAPQTIPQGKVVAHGDHLLLSPKVLVDSNILPLTLEETIQKTASVFQVNSEAFLLANKPVAENIGIVKTNTLQSQESLMTSTVSSPCKENLIHDQFVDLNFPSQVANTSMQPVQLNTEDAVIAVSVDNIHAADLIQDMKSVEIETNAQLKQFLTPKTEKLKPEQAISQVSNLKKKETAADAPNVTAKSLQSQSVKENPKKPFVGSWVKGLLSRGASFMPPCVSAHSRNTISDLQPSVKGANNFGGFKTKGINRKASRVSRKSRDTSKPPPVSGPPASPPSSSSTAAHPCANTTAASEAVKKGERASNGAHLNHNSHGNENCVSSVNHGGSVEDQIRKLRLKLLKKLKAKKKKLAALTSSPQSGKLPSENLEEVPQGGSPNDCESIEDLLNELQHQIDIADKKAGCTTVSGVSPYSSQSHEEILAELLSPTTVVSTELSGNGEADFRYLEMGDNAIPAPAPGESNSLSQNTYLGQDHIYCSPTKKNPCEVEPDSLTNNACGRTLNLESPMKNDIFDEFFSTSSLNSLANDALDLPHFDEYLFENC